MDLPRGPIASRGGSVPIFLRELVATCDFPGGGGVAADPLSPILIRPRPCNIYLLYLLSGVDYLINSLDPNEVCIFLIRNAIKNGLYLSLLYVQKTQSVTVSIKSR